MADKHHNWVTSGKVVDRKTDLMAARLLDCNHLTPAREREINEAMGMEVTAPTGEHQAADEAYDWMDVVEPDPSEL